MAPGELEERDAREERTARTAGEAADQEEVQIDRGDRAANTRSFALN